MIGEIIKLEISATSVAWYGAIVATASVIATGYNVLRDRAKLRIDIKPNMKVYPSTTPYGDTTNVVVSVVNVGRRPITISSVWFERDKASKSLLLSDSLHRGSIELAEGKGSDYLCNQAQPEMKDIRYACVLDSKGRTHRKRVSKKIRNAISRSEGEVD